jgi:hypothetical protein
MKNLLFVSTMLILASGTVATAEEDVALTGFIYLNAENCKKGAVTAECQINIEISGAGAKAIYDNMAGKPQPEPCTEGKVKYDGKGLRCYFTSEKKYQCDFGYNFARKKLVGSDQTC